MTTSKKSTTKKRAVSKAKSGKQPAAKSKASSVKASKPRSFRLEKDQDKFLSTNVTRQSLYWIVFGIVVIAFASWILKVQADVQDIYDKIEANTMSEVEMNNNYADKIKDLNEQNHDH